MPAKKNPKIIKNDKKVIKKAETKTEKKEKTESEKRLEKNLQKAVISQNDIKLAKEDKILEKVERYVDKNREKTSQEMIERKSKRPVVKYKESDIEVMITRISTQSQPKEDRKETSKQIIYTIYAIIIIAAIFFIMKYFSMLNIPQI